MSQSSYIQPFDISCIYNVIYLRIYFNISIQNNKFNKAVPIQICVSNTLYTYFEKIK